MPYDDRERAPRCDRERLLFKTLRDCVSDAKARCPGWATRLNEVDPSELHSRDILSAVPITRKSHLIADQDASPPFAGLARAGAGSFPRLFMSPGPICEPQLSAADPWGAARALYAAGLRSGDTLLNTFSYHLTPGGFMFDSGARENGCAVIPAGPGNTEQQVQAIARYRPTAYGGTADFLNLLLQSFSQINGAEFPIKRAILSGAAVPQNLRARFNEAGIAVYELYGTAELGVVAYETDAHEGFVVNEDLIVEILDPVSAKPVMDGEPGEVVVTRLARDYPLFRFATGDLSAVITEPSPCGRTNLRLRGWLGRADQTTKIKGMFVHPEQVIAVVARIPGAARGRLVVTRRDDRDNMTLEIETSQGSIDLEAATALLAAVTKLRGNVVVVGEGSVPQNGAIVDQRPA
ncbi:MAG: AMP-dependent synthetase [Bradyrhizobiaceae bacterium PARB1]|jgi:phenylacetate-CoA ligase|nr:MAG: AMP-dependent synthetase [Bradyrhizobiaceae bacterium PARB1]